MKIEQAIRLLHPDTTSEEIAEIEYKNGFRDEQAAVNKINEACEMACKAMEKQIPKKVEVQQWIYTKCECGYEFSEHHGDGYYSIPYDKKTDYCPKCGQALDWGDT